jgi:TP901 family phage tail tape measure protein
MKTEWRLKVSENGSSALAKLSRHADDTSNRFSKLDNKLSRLKNSFDGADSRFQKLGSTLQKTGKQADGFFGNFMSGMGTNFTSISGMGGNMAATLGGAAATGVAAVAALAVAGGVYATNLAMSFDKGMAKINATAQLTRPELNKLRDELLDLGKNNTGDIERIPDAYEKILSQTGDVALSMSILKTSLKGAQAGFADIDIVAGATAQTLSIVGKHNTTADEVMNTLLKAKKVGAGEFTDFAQYLPQLIAAGSNLGIQFKDTAGAFAFMTSKGQSAADSAMLIQNAYSALGKVEIQKGLKGAGVEVFNARGEMNTLDVIFTNLHTKLARMTDQQKSGFLESIGLVDQQARSAFAILSGDAQTLKTTMASVRDSTGELQSQLEATQTPSQKVELMWNKIKGAFIEIGYRILPYVADFIDWIMNGVGGIVTSMREWYAESELLQDVVWALGKAFEGIGLVLDKMGDHLSWLWNNTLKPLFAAIENAYKMTKGLLTGDMDLAATGAMNQTNGKVVDDIERLSGQKVQIVDGQVKLVGKPKAPETPGTNEPTFSKLPPKPMVDNSYNDSSLKKTLAQGTTAISDGGKSVKNFTVNINKQIETVNFKSDAQSQSGQDLVATLEELMLRAIQGVELTMSSSNS